MRRPPSSDQRLVAHVDRIEQTHPPISFDSVDFTVRRPALVRDRYGATLDYLARVELEVDRNVLELLTMLPHPPEIDRRFYAEVWQPQEIQHGRILDHLQTLVGRPPTTPDLDTVSAKIRVLGALAHLAPVQDVVRLLYYLTGAATERSAVLAYNRLHDGLRDAGEKAIASTVVAQIRRQEPAHFAFYKLSAEQLVPRLRTWQLWMARQLRSRSFGPVGANNTEQKADFGGVIAALGMTEEIDTFAEDIARVERSLLWARTRGMDVPTYVLDAMREAVALHRARES